MTEPLPLELSPESLGVLKALAPRYVWWKTPDEALKRPRQVIAQVMKMGDHDDLMDLTESIGDQALAQVLVHADPGQFDERSWNYWHIRLGVSQPPDYAPPPMPVRVFP